MNEILKRLRAPRQGVRSSQSTAFLHAAHRLQQLTQNETKP